MENIKEEKARELMEILEDWNFGNGSINDLADTLAENWYTVENKEMYEAGFDAGKQERDLPDIELVSAKVHEAWIESKKAQGVTSRKSEIGEELMVPYGDLSEEAKDLDRVTVKTVYKAIENLSK